LGAENPITPILCGSRCHSAGHGPVMAPAFEKTSFYSEATPIARAEQNQEQISRNSFWRCNWLHGDQTTRRGPKNDKLLQRLHKERL